MEASPAEPSEPIDDGSVEAVTARLLLWCKRTPPALAQVEFVDDHARRLVVERLRSNLGASEIYFEEVSLPAETADLFVADHLVDRLRRTPAGVVSVDGFAAVFPYDRSKLEESIYRLSVQRELLASPSHRQIWWLPIYLADLFEMIAPDLESWIQLKLRLTVAGSAVGPIEAGSVGDSMAQPRAEATTTGLESAPDPTQARLQAEDALRRFQRAVEQGSSPMEGITSLVQPALDLLRRAKLDQEARELERRTLEVVVQHLDQPARSDVTQTQVDVFISYTSSDSSWAKWLDFILREAGYTTKVQLYDFTAGNSFVGAMTEALTRSRWVLSLLSPAYLESPWCQEEWQAAHLAKKLLPLRIADCKPEGLLAPLIYVDLVGVSENEAQRRILAELGKRDGEDLRARIKPAFSGVVSAAPRPAFPSSLPPIWNLTKERNPDFIGRDDLLRRLHQALTSRKTAAIPQIITGLGGVGKTQLALEYAYRYASDYEGVWWLHAGEPLTLARDYAGLAPHFGMAAAADQGQIVREVREQLSQRQRILLIFDDATEPGTLDPYLPLGPGRQVIVTTRTQNWPGADAQEVHELPLEAAISLLLRRTGQTDQAAAEDLAKRLGCLPLALDVAASYIVTRQKRIRDYAVLLPERGLDIQEKGQPHQHEPTVGLAWALAFDQVESKCPAAVDLLYLCAFLAPEAIYVRELASASKHLPERLAKALTNEASLDEMKAALLAYSLIYTDGDTISIHRLVSDFVRRRMATDTREQWIRTALSVVNELLPVDAEDVRVWAAYSRWLGHALTVVNWDNAEVVQPIACARILNQSGSYLGANANYNQAEPLFRRALAISEQNLGPNHPHVATCLGNLAGLLQATNRLVEAERLNRRALAIDEKNLGPSHPRVAIRLNNLAVVLRATNRLAEAESLLRRALAIDEQDLGPIHPNVAFRLLNLAGLLKATNRLSEAEPLYRRALAINEQSLGTNHPRVAVALNDLAMLLCKTNRLSEAEPLFRRALSISEQSLGPNHPDVAIRLNNLAGLLRDEHRLSEAGPLLRRAVNIVESRLGPDHPWTRNFRKNLDLLLGEQDHGRS